MVAQRFAAGRDEPRVSGRDCRGPAAGGREVGVPAVVWASSWSTWHLGISSKPVVATSSVATALSYIAVLAALGSKKQVVMTDVKSGEKAVSGVLPNSMVQRIVIWIALLALLLVALMIAGWVATVGWTTPGGRFSSSDPWCS